ncbi:MAG: hypothetical protein U0136_05440 [Bdellovibrionota bacterium]
MRYVVALLLVLLTPFTAAHAVPPPDFLFNAGSQLVQTFSVICVCLSAFFSVGYRQLTAVFYGKKRLAIGVSLVVVILLSIILTFGIEVMWK